MHTHTQLSQRSSETLKEKGREAPDEGSSLGPGCLLSSLGLRGIVGNTKASVLIVSKEWGIKGRDEMLESGRERMERIGAPLGRRNGPQKTRRREEVGLGPEGGMR